MKSINELEVNTSTYSGSCYPAYLLLEYNVFLSHVLVFAVQSYLNVYYSIDDSLGLDPLLDLILVLFLVH